METAERHGRKEFWRSPGCLDSPGGLEREQELIIFSLINLKCAIGLRKTRERKQLICFYFGFGIKIGLWGNRRAHTEQMELYESRVGPFLGAQ